MRYVALPLLIFSLALMVRLWNIGFGLPFLYPTDEVHWVLLVQRMLKSGSFNPDYFVHPSLYYYANLLAYYPYFLAGKALGLWNTVADIPAPRYFTMGVGYTSAPSTFLLGRCLTALFGAGSCVLSYLITKSLTDNKGAPLIAALLLVISPLNVYHSKLISGDSYVVFFVLLSFFFTVSNYYSPSKLRLFLAGFSAGLAASAKYNGGFVLLIVLFYGYKAYRRIYSDHTNLAVFIKVAAAAGWAAFLGFALTSPYALLEFDHLIHDLQLGFGVYYYGNPDLKNRSFITYLSLLFNKEGALAMSGMLLALCALFRGSQEMRMLAFFSLGYFIFICFFSVATEYVMMPIIPFLYSIIAIAIYQLIQSRYFNRPLVRIVTFSFLVSLTIPTIFRMISQTNELAQIDNREFARVWINENLPKGSKIAVEGYTSYVDPDKFDVHGYSFITEHDPTYYQRQNFDYILSSEAFLLIHPTVRDRELLEARYKKLAQLYQLYKVFNQKGFEIYLYKRP